MARTDFKLKGVDKFMRNLNNEIRKLEGRTLDGLIEAAIVLQREAEPGTPIDTGNLRASWFTVTTKSDKSKKVAPESGKFKSKGITPEQLAQLRSDHIRVKESGQALVKAFGKSSEPLVMFGYTANYAVFVHEILDLAFQRPTAQSRWLFKAMQTAKPKMLIAIQRKARF